MPLLDKTGTFYNVLLDRVGEQIAGGKPLNEIKKDLDLPEYKKLVRRQGAARYHIEAAYRAQKNSAAALGMFLNDNTKFSGQARLSGRCNPERLLGRRRAADFQLEKI